MELKNERERRKEANKKREWEWKKTTTTTTRGQRGGPRWMGIWNVCMPKMEVKTSKRNAKWKIKLYDERLNGKIKRGLLFGYSFVSISDSITIIRIIIFLCFFDIFLPNHFDQLRSTNKLYVIYILIIPCIFYWYGGTTACALYSRQLSLSLSVSCYGFRLFSQKDNRQIERERKLFASNSKVHQEHQVQAKSIDTLKYNVIMHLCRSKGCCINYNANLLIIFPSSVHIP